MSDVSAVTNPLEDMAFQKFDAEAVLPDQSSADLSRAVKLGGVVVGSLLILSAVVPIGGAVLGTGQIGVESRVKRISHPFGGVISEILVHNGEHVRRGQLLMRLDDQVTRADATYSSLTVEQLLAQGARLDAERMGASAVVFPAELTGARSTSAARAMADELRLFELRRTEQEQLRAQLQSRIVQLSQQIVSFDAQIAALRQQLALIGPEREGVRDLWDQGLVTINRLNQMERTASAMDGRVASLRAQIAQTRSQISETQERIIQMAQTRRVEAGEQLTRVLATLNEQKVKSVTAGDQQKRSEIRAPYSGTIEKVSFTSMGEVVRPADMIMEIVPDADRKVVEVSISPVDIDQVRKGQTARVRFSSFNVAATPEFVGKVTYVATDRTEPAKQGMPYYLVRIEMNDQQVRKEGLDLRSGMPAEVQIETGSRSMLSYVTKPLRDQFARAFRDN